MNKSAARPLAAAAVAALAVGTFGAGPATAGGDHDGKHNGKHNGKHDGYDVTISLTERVSDELRDGHNGVVATGKADTWARGDRIVLSFPVRTSERRAKHHDVTALLGGVAFTGDGPDVSWTKLRLNAKRGVITAVVSGDRKAILRFAKQDGRHDGRHRGKHGASGLRLTKAGAASLNQAAAGTPFEAGDVFAGGRDCGR